jgi:hypothetical protein
MAFPGVNTISLGGSVLPGKWSLMPGGAEFIFQEQQGIGLDGASLRIIGAKLAYPSFVAEFWKVADWDAFQPLRKKFLTKAVYAQLGSQGTTYAIGIVHPELNFLGITSVVLAKAPWFVNVGKGRWVGQVDFKQYRPSKVAPESPDAAIPAAAEPAPSAQDAFEQEQLLHRSQTQGARG